MDKVYFYNFITEQGPKGGHPQGHQTPDVSSEGTATSPYEVEYEYPDKDGNIQTKKEKYNSKREALDIANNTQADSDEEQAIFNKILGGG